MTTTLPSGTKH